MIRKAEAAGGTIEVGQEARLERLVQSCEEDTQLACHLRRLPSGNYEATTGDNVTLFAEHYDSRPQGLPSDYLVNDSDFSYKFAEHPIKGERLPCLGAKYADQEIVRHPNAVQEINFTVQSGEHLLRMFFSVGGSPYDSGKLEEDGGDGSTQALCRMSAEYPVATITIEGKP